MPGGACSFDIKSGIGRSTYELFEIAKFVNIKYLLYQICTRLNLISLKLNRKSLRVQSVPHLFQRQRVYLKNYYTFTFISSNDLLLTRVNTKNKKKKYSIVGSCFSIRVRGAEFSKFHLVRGYIYYYICLKINVLYIFCT